VREGASKVGYGFVDVHVYICECKSLQAHDRGPGGEVGSGTAQLHALVVDSFPVFQSTSASCQSSVRTVSASGYLSLLSLTAMHVHLTVSADSSWLLNHRQQNSFEDTHKDWSPSTHLVFSLLHMHRTIIQRQTGQHERRSVFDGCQRLVIAQGRVCLADTITAERSQFYAHAIP